MQVSAVQFKVEEREVLHHVLWIQYLGNYHNVLLVEEAQHNLGWCPVVLVSNLNQLRRIHEARLVLAKRGIGFVNNPTAGQEGVHPLLLPTKVGFNLVHHRDNI